MSTIPASAFVNVTPGVLSAGGSALDLNGLMLTENTRAPIGAVLSFPTQIAVAAYFGPNSDEATAATDYFLGFQDSNVKPGALLVSQYNAVAVAAWLRGGSIAALTLSQLQAITGSLSIVIDGYTWSYASVDLSSATSPSNAAALLQTGLRATPPQAAAVTGAISTTTLTVSAVGSGVVVVGNTVTGAGVAANTRIIALGSGTGGTGTYTVNNSQTVASEALTMVGTNPTVTYDSVSGGFVVTSGLTGAISTIAAATGGAAAPLCLTTAAGAVTSQGAAAATPASAMNAIVNQTQNWATFFSVFDPDGGSGNTVKQAFQAWNNGQNNRYLYAAWDTDITPTLSTAASTSLGYILDHLNSSGCSPIFGPDFNQAAFLAGAVASIDFTEHNGRTTMSFRRQSGLVPTESNQTAYQNLVANGYNSYVAVATANDQFQFFSPGSVTGEFEWIDSYVNQIWLNNSFQLALIELFLNTKAIPYNDAGYNLIRAACMDPINAGLNFGAFVPGVPLSSAQAAEVNYAAGLKIDNILSAQGWYLQILPATAQVRAARGSPPMTFWYMDGGSVQKINLASIEVQ